MALILTIFFVISILLCFISVTIFTGVALRRNHVGYEPLSEVLKSRYIDHTFIHKNDAVYKDYGDDFYGEA